MSIGDTLLDLLDLFNVIDRAEGALAGLLNFERGTHGKRLRKRGMVQLKIDRSKHVPADVERYLNHYGVPIHGRRITSKEAIFSVPAQQAAWAKVLLERMGTPQQPQAWADNPKGKR